MKMCLQKGDYIMMNGLERVIIYLNYPGSWLVGWLVITMKDNKTIEIVFLKNESRTMIIFVSDLFLKANFTKHDHFR